MIEAGYKLFHTMIGTLGIFLLFLESSAVP
jgi:hypothetical protein